MGTPSSGEPLLQSCQLSGCSRAIYAFEYHKVFKYLSSFHHCWHTSDDEDVAQAAYCKQLPMQAG